MSTKTTFKRIALVAVAALGLGVLSVAPSSAAVTNLTTVATDGTATTAVSDSSTAATLAVSFVKTASTDTVTVQSFVSAYPTGATVSALRVTGIDSSTATTETKLFAADLSTNLPFTTAYDTATNVDVIKGTGNTAVRAGITLGYYFDSTSGLLKGTYTVTTIITPFNAGVAGTATTKDVNIVVSALASASQTPSAGYSVAYLANGNTASPTADSATVSAVSTASVTTAAANLYVKIGNAAGNQATDTVTVTITGPGVLNNGGVYTKYAKFTALAANTNYVIYGDGSAGVSTIKVSYELAAVSYTKTMTFYAANATTITTSVRTPLLTTAAANTGAVGVTAVDVNGNPWLGKAYIVASSAADALIAGSTTPQPCADWNASDGIRCPVTALTAGTAKFKVIDASTVAAAKATSAEFSLVVSTAPAAGVKVEFDKATYNPYEKATITVYPVDAAGNAIQWGTYPNLLASGGISATQAFTGTSDTLTATDITTEKASSSTSGVIALKKIYTVYMPAQGTVTLSWTGGAALPVAGQVKGTTSATVTNSAVDAATDAANEATDAANAATDAALAAADAADAATAAAQDASDAVAALSATVAKLVASLKAQITSLTNLVIKIQKKVKA